MKPLAILWRLGLSLASGGRCAGCPAGGASAARGRGHCRPRETTVFLRHDETRTLGETDDRLRRQRFYESVPPKGVEVLSWTVVMGIGQVVTLRFPAERLREVNRALESTAWGGYRTAFYPTYDDRPTAQPPNRPTAQPPNRPTAQKEHKL